MLNVITIGNQYAIECPHCKTYYGPTSQCQYSKLQVEYKTRNDIYHRGSEEIYFIEDWTAYLECSACGAGKKEHKEVWRKSYSSDERWREQEKNNEQYIRDKNPFKYINSDELLPPACGVCGGRGYVIVGEPSKVSPAPPPEERTVSVEEFLQMVDEKD